MLGPHDRESPSPEALSCLLCFGGDRAAALVAILLHFPLEGLERRASSVLFLSDKTSNHLLNRAIFIAAFSEDAPVEVHPVICVLRTCADPEVAPFVFSVGRLEKEKHGSKQQPYYPDGTKPNRVLPPSRGFAALPVFPPESMFVLVGGVPFNPYCEIEMATAETPVLGVHFWGGAGPVNLPIHHLVESRQDGTKVGIHWTCSEHDSVTAETLRSNSIIVSNSEIGNKPGFR